MLVWTPDCSKYSIYCCAARHTCGTEHAAAQPHVRQETCTLEGALVSVPHTGVVHGQHGGWEFLFGQAPVTVQLIMAADPAL